MIVGYRSDVRIITTKKGYNELKKYTDKYLNDKKWDYGNLLDEVTINEETRYAKYLGWNNIKWYQYSDYEDVNAIMNGLDYLKENNFSYRYARIGENYDDYEESYFESELEDEQDLEYPSMERYFDDDYVIHNLNEQDKDDNLEV